MGGGKERKASMQLQTDLAKQQAQTGQEYLGLAKGEQARRLEYQQPSVDFYKKLTGADPTARMTAVAPALADQAKAARGAQGAIMEGPRGVGRDYALSQLPVQQYQQGADYLNKAYMGAFPALAGLGTEAGSTGLQMTGAGLRGTEGAAGTNKGIMDTQQQQKASQLNMIGSIAGGIGGGLAGGGLTKLFSKAPVSAAGKTFNLPGMGAVNATNFDPVKFMTTPGLR